MLYSQKVQIPNSYSQPYMLRLRENSGSFAFLVILRSEWFFSSGFENK